jgi:hypothetical protein
MEIMKRQQSVQIVKMLTLFLVCFSGLSLLLMLLWNSLIPVIFNGPVITYFQSLGLLLLVRILSSGFRPSNYYSQNKGGYWQKKFEEKIAAMPPEQRERIRNMCASKCSKKWDMKQKTATAESASAG